jgi:hypothetical protein
VKSTKRHVFLVFSLRNITIPLIRQPAAKFAAKLAVAAIGCLHPLAAAASLAAKITQPLAACSQWLFAARGCMQPNSSLTTLGWMKRGGRRRRWQQILLDKNCSPTKKKNVFSFRHKILHPRHGERGEIYSELFVVNLNEIKFNEQQQWQRQEMTIVPSSPHSASSFFWKRVKL